MYNAHEGKIVFSPYYLKIHKKRKKNILYHNKTLFFPKSVPFQNPIPSFLLDRSSSIIELN
ncbi:hypothetical protein Hanom_Chr01g00018421 [Helianthus anomalus]